MPLSFGKALCIAALIHPGVPQAYTSSLPPALQSTIPTCAQSCLSDQIARDFPSSVCSASNDLDCLCSHYGVDGYTLGERAFGCLFSSDCSAEARANATSVYTICNGAYNAVAPTQKTVVVTASSAFSTTRTTSSSGRTIRTTSMASSLPSAASTGSSSAATQATMEATPTDGPTMSNKSSIPLTEAQVAGIAIASIALVVLTVGIAGCLLFVRRRNKRLEQEEKLFVQHSRNASGSGSHFGGPTKNPRGGIGGVGISPLQQPATPSGSTPPQVQERTWPRYYPIMPDDNLGIGLAQTTNAPIPQAYTVPYRQSYQPPYDAPNAAMPSMQQEQSWPVPAQRQSTGVIPSNPPPPPQPPAPSPPQTASSRRSRTSLQATPPRPPPQASMSPYNPITPPQAPIPSPPQATSFGPSRASKQVTPPRALPQSSISPPSAFVSPPKVTPPRPSRSSMEGRSTQQGRQSVDRNTVVSQVTEFEEDASAQPFVVSPEEPQPLQRPPFGDPSRSNSEFSDLSNNVMPMPQPRTMPGKRRSSRAPPLRIQIPPYSSPSSSSIGGPEPAAKPQPPMHAQQAQPSPPQRKSPQKSAMASASRPSPKARKKPSFTIAQISPSDSPLKHSSPRSDPSSTLRSSGVFPTRMHEIKPKPERQSRSRPKSGRSQRRPSDALRDSYASFTSFESLGSEDDPTPPKEEEKQLSAVSEHSPIAGLTYPKVPRSSNQRAARTPPSPKLKFSPIPTPSPKQVTPTPSPKQKCSAAPGGIENQLWRTELGEASNGSPSRQATPQRQPAPPTTLATPPNPGSSAQPPTGYFQPQAPQFGQSQAQTWSWTSGQDPTLAQFNPASPFGPMPKLTPTRRGEDLYLKVG